MPGEFTCLCLPVMVFNPLLFAVGVLRREECNECGNLEFPGHHEEVCWGMCMGQSRLMTKCATC